MRKLYLGLISALWIGATTGVLAQGNGPGVRGARAAALGNASATLNDVWSVGNNVAGLGQIRRTSIGFYAANQFVLRALNSTALAVALPIGAVAETDTKAKNGVIGVEAQRFGDRHYAEQRLGAGYGYRGGQVSVGVRADLLQLSIEGLGSRRAVALSLGGQAEIVPQRLVFGAYLYNLNQAKLARYEDERVPTVLKAGLSYRPSKKLMLNVETEKDVEQDVNVKAGLEYQVIEALALRVGLSSLTEQTTAGVGFLAGRFHIDYAAAWQTALGLSQHVGISFQTGVK
ncbi:hypothetical protein [Hymenobacter sp. GOD-10R]|uniref:hypothetical protein n=1 Tax=Hymenobacter sp. GOD-10R TaxID=3093922 RepID=UPI002D7A138D|nr:hypothetical protein [Hymenobacter sp. GOD-10R]WRQ27494.1 hypothetical protein SD425_20705 [Hymenobacter sp. GOD-10R]